MEPVEIAGSVAAPPNLKLAGFKTHSYYGVWSETTASYHDAQKSVQTPLEQSMMITIANKMLDKRLKPNPHFNQFIKNYINQSERFRLIKIVQL